LPSNEDELEK